MKSNGETTCDNKEMAEILLNQYSSMFSQPVNEIYDIKKFHRSLYDNMNDLYISEEDIKRALKS